jgi:hypothetical protein
MFYVQIFLVSFPYKNFSNKNANPSFYIKYVENGYFPLLSKFEKYKEAKAKTKYFWTRLP